MTGRMNQPEKAARLFGGWQETMIWSCLQGVMGAIFANSEKEPDSAMALPGDQMVQGLGRAV